MGLGKLLLPVAFSLLVATNAQAKMKKVKKVDCMKQPKHADCRPVLRLDARRPSGLAKYKWKNNLRTWRDLSASRLSGVLSGGFATTTANPWIKQSKKLLRPASLSFNGVDQYVNFGTATELQLREAFAIEIWFKPVSEEGEVIDSQILVNKEGEYELALYGSNENDNQVWFALANLTPGWRFTGVAAPIEKNAWHHLVWTYDMNVTSGDNLFVYHNGMPIYSEQGTGKIDRSNPGTYPGYDDFRIGGRQLPSSTEYFQGEISILKVYQRMLSPEEINRHCLRHSLRFQINCE